ncbi:hypothetical protein ACAW74_21225 [Fibrella sp. WM1]|uniref:hypothetical protein n=1 Tax=Fibrella musci TaxID=3242485 RepID=UPI0035223310
MLTTLSGTYRDGAIILNEAPQIDHEVPVLVTFLQETTPLLAEQKGIRLGSWKGKYSLPDDFNDPIDDLADYM